MDKVYRDTMTPQMRHDLAIYCYEQGFLDDEPTFGKYRANLDLGNDVQPLVVSPWQPQPDPHYFAIAGQEPPQEPPSKPWYKQPEIVAMLVAIVFLWSVLAFYPY